MGDHVGTTLPRPSNGFPPITRTTTPPSVIASPACISVTTTATGRVDRGCGGSGRCGGGGEGRGGRPREGLSRAKNDARRHSMPGSKKRCENDPVDVATGEMILTHTCRCPGCCPSHCAARTYPATVRADMALPLDNASNSIPSHRGSVGAAGRFPPRLPTASRGRRRHRDLRSRTGARTSPRQSAQGRDHGDRRAWRHASAGLDGRGAARLAGTARLYARGLRPQAHPARGLRLSRQRHRRYDAGRPCTRSAALPPPRAPPVTSIDALTRICLPPATTTLSD